MTEFNRPDLRVETARARAPIEAANLLAGHAVAYATAFLDGRNDATDLAQNVDRLQLDLLAASDPSTNGILDPVRLLNVAMMHTAGARGEARQDRWQQVMGSLVELVREESLALRRETVVPAA
jgi:hypothetical protein